MSSPLLDTFIFPCTSVKRAEADTSPHGHSANPRLKQVVGERGRLFTSQANLHMVVLLEGNISLAEVAYRWSVEDL